MAVIDLSETLAMLEVELAKQGIAQRQQAWQGDFPTGLRRWVILDPQRLRRLVGDAIAEADGRDELATLTAEAKQTPSPLSHYLGAMSPAAIANLMNSLRTTTQLPEDK